MKVEIINEGTLLWLMVNDEPVSCSTMHELEDRFALFSEGKKLIQALYEAENRSRRVPVTLESFVRKIALKDLADYCIADGSKTIKLLHVSYC